MIKTSIPIRKKVKTPIRKKVKTLLTKKSRIIIQVLILRGLILNPKKEKAAGLPFLMWEVWAERHERLHREKPTQDAKFFKHLKDLAGKLAARIEAQGAEVSDAAICNNFGLFLDMLIQKGDGWYHTNFTPDIFNGKFLNIIQLLKQQHNEEQQLADKYARVIASFAN